MDKKVCKLCKDYKKCSAWWSGVPEMDTDCNGAKFKPYVTEKDGIVVVPQKIKDLSNCDLFKKIGKLEFELKLKKHLIALLPTNTEKEVSLFEQGKTQAIEDLLDWMENVDNE